MKSVHPNPPKKTPVSKVATNLNEAVRRRAEEIYIRNGRVPGHDVENWVLAEQEVLREMSEQPILKKTIVVRVGGVEYFGEYDTDSADGYMPGEFGKGAPVPVRFEGQKMFVQRPNGKELETTIIRQIPD
jgi:Protein of unknown function (DUF2934)